MSTEIEKNQFIEKLTTKRYQSLDSGQKKFVDEWISTHYINLIFSFRAYAAVVLIVGASGAFFFLPFRPAIFFCLGGLSTAVLLYLWHFSSLNSDFNGQWVWYAMVISLVGFESLAVADIFKVSAIGGEHFWVTESYSSAVFFMVVACPYFGVTSIVSAMLGIGFGFWAFSSSNLFSDIILFGALVVIGVTGWVLNRMAFTSAFSEAYAQLVRRDLLRQNEDLKKENLEKELYLAREVQDSFLPPEGGLKLSDGYKATFFKTNSHTLGGDWMAYRMVGSTLVAMILDATGKGTAAALVVHAVQSLWVQNLSYPNFDVKEWIEGVNRTLSNFGHKNVHSVTMGVVSYQPGKNLTYYSCGHVPIFMTCEDPRGGHKVISLTGGGDILGLKQECQIGHASVGSEISSIRSIFLGTDGIFPQGTRTNRRFIVSLEDHLEKHDDSYLTSIDSKDDKLLLWIHKEAV